MHFVCDVCPILVIEQDKDGFAMGKKVMAIILLMAVAAMCWSATSATYYLKLTINHAPVVSLNATADNQVRATWSFDPNEASVGLTAPDGIDVDVSEVAGYGSATCTVSEGRRGPARVTCTITAS